MRQMIIRSIFLFYLLASYLNATHIHMEESAHADDCKVCMVAKVFQSADVPDTSLPHTIALPVHRSLYIAERSNVSACIKGFLSTAPPSF